MNINKILNSIDAENMKEGESIFKLISGSQNLIKSQQETEKKLSETTVTFICNFID